MASVEIDQSQWIERARKVLPAGGFGNYDPQIIIREGHGARVTDENGKEYIDLLIGSGPMLVGHGHPEVLAAAHQQIDKGMTFFANNTLGIELAEEICRAVPCAEQVRYVSSGGEADMYALRVARAATGRNKILKFEGGYHGMSAEALMSLAPTRLENFPNAVADSAGIPDSVRSDMVIAPFNDIDTTTEFIEEHAEQLAAVIVEPLQRLIPPAPGFLEQLKEQTSKHGIILIFDEIVTGFRLAYGGAQEYYGVTPDLCTLGKIVGGGFALAAITGRQDLMSHFDKTVVGNENFTFQVGTLSGNPVASAAGLATMKILRQTGSYETLHRRGNSIMLMLGRELEKAGHAHQIVGEPVLFDVVFSDNPVSNYRDILQADGEKANRFNALLRAQGILKAPSKIYPSLALTDNDVEQLEVAIAAAAAEL